MRHRWDSVAFLHWPYDPDDVQRLLPSGLTVETYEDRAWVGLVPFRMEVSPPRGGSGPWFRFPETNVRTYVRNSDGETGVWFFSLDADHLAAVVTARSTYRVPYFWSEMRVDRDEELMTYSTRRRWPGSRGASSRIVVEVGEPYLADELGDFDHYLTARWTLFGTWGRTLLIARAEHQPWPLHRARVDSWHDDLVAAVGVPRPDSEPVVHWSPGVDVRVGYPSRSR